MSEQTITTVQIPRQVNRASLPSRKRWAGTSMLAVPPAVLTLAVALFGAGTRGLTSDEYTTWYAAHLSVGEVVRLAGHVDAVLMPYYLFMHGWMTVFGDSALSLRMPSALAMASTAAIVVVIGRRLFDSGAGLSAGLIFASLPMVTRFAQEARPSASAIGLTTLATLLLMRALDQPAWRRWLLYGGCVTLAGLTHIVALTMLVVHGLVVVRAIRAGGDLRRLRWFAAASAVITVALPLVAKGSSQSSTIDSITVDARTLPVLPGLVFGSTWVALTVMTAALLVVVLLRASGPGTFLLLCWALVPLALCVLTFPFTQVFTYRYLLLTVPAWVLLASGFGFALVRRLKVRGLITPSPAIALIIAAMVVVAGLDTRIGPHRSPRDGGPDFRGAAAIVERQMRAEDGIVFAGSDLGGRLAFGYELRDVEQPRDVLAGRPARSTGTYSPQHCIDLSVCVGDTPRIWLVTTTDAGQDPYFGLDRSTAAYLGSLFAAVPVARVDGVRVFLLRRQSR